MIRLAMVGVVTALVANGCGGSNSGEVDASPDAPQVPDASALDATIADAMPDAEWPADGGVVDPLGTHYQYVFDRISMPTTASKANMFGLNLDGDPQGRPDNALGQILSTLAAQGGTAFDSQAAMDQQVDRGEVLHLVDLQATSLATSAGAGFSIYLGTNPGTAPCVDANDTVCRGHLDGSTTFDVDPASAADPTLAGSIVGGALTAGHGHVVIELPLLLGATPVVLDLVGARVEVQQVGLSGLIQGRLGGALTQESVDQTVLPAIHTNISNTIAAECSGTSPPCCPEGSTGELMLDLFDESNPQDCVVTLQELRNNSLISSLLTPDVDLFVGDPANGIFAPRVDGVKDCLSIGIGFSATTAVFTQP